jgi:hypothetical protein
LARPKSASFTVPSVDRMMLAGLMSRWTSPAACAAASPRQASAITRVASGQLKGPRRRMKSAAVPPSTSSIARKCRPRSSPTSNTATVLGWISRPAARASCTKRLRATGSRLSRSGSTLTATRRSSEVSTPP